MKDLIDFEPKSKRPASYASDNGTYRFYTSSDTIKKCLECDFKSDKPLIIFGTGGKGSLFIDNEFSCSADNFICKLKSKFTIEYTNYIYQYIKSNWKNFLFKMFNGSTLGHINQTRLNDFQIPIPNDITKLKPILTKLSKFHSKISDITEQIPQKEKEICELIKTLTAEGKEGVDWDEYKLGDICDLTTGDSKFILKNKIYPIYGGGGITGYCENYNFDCDNNLLISRVGNSLINGDCLRIIKGKIYLNENGFICKNINHHS
jgi:restriction endonuclease S subunit